MSQQRLVGVKGDECQCGRRESIRHCPACGTTRVYARQNRNHKLLSGEYRFVEIEFRCQTCGHLFIDEERMFCEAPPVGRVLAQRKVQALAEAKKTGEYMTPVEEKAAKAILELTGEAQEEQSEMTQEQLVQMDWDIRRAWADANLKGETKLKPDDYIIKMLEDAKTSPTIIERVKAFHEERNAKQRAG